MRLKSRQWMYDGNYMLIHKMGGLCSIASGGLTWPDLHFNALLWHTFLMLVLCCLFTFDVSALLTLLMEVNVTRVLLSESQKH